jgi:hypothetical protein
MCVRVCGISLSVDFAKHKIHGTDNGDGIGKQVSTGDLVETSEVSKSGGTDLASVRAFTAITDHIHTHLTLGSFNGRVCLARRDGVTLGEQEEVVDKGFHVLLHGSTGWGADLVVFNLDGSRRHLVQALVDNPEGLAELFHTAEVSVVAVTVVADGNIEFDLVVGIVWLRLADVPGNTGTTEHDTGKAHVKSIGSGDYPNSLGSSQPDTVIRKKFFGFVNAVAELSGPLVDIVKQPDGDILRNTTWADVSGVETGTRNTFVEFLNRIS